MRALLLRALEIFKCPIALLAVVFFIQYSETLGNCGQFAVAKVRKRVGKLGGGDEKGISLKRLIGRIEEEGV